VKQRRRRRILPHARHRRGGVAVAGWEEEGANAAAVVVDGHAGSAVVQQREEAPDVNVGLHVVEFVQSFLYGRVTDADVGVSGARRQALAEAGQPLGQADPDDQVLAADVPKHAVDRATPKLPAVADDQLHLVGGAGHAVGRIECSFGGRQDQKRPCARFILI
jgi:hypothetical protein